MIDELFTAPTPFEAAWKLAKQIRNYALDKPMRPA
jgi:hypothetical protein